jgi:hypothetical protein
LIEQLKQLADQGKDLPAALIDVSSHRGPLSVIIELTG